MSIRPSPKAVPRRNIDSSRRARKKSCAKCGVASDGGVPGLARCPATTSAHCPHGQGTRS
eukprot:6427323-Pyramimonas_sp.AAC.1